MPLYSDAFKDLPVLVLGGTGFIGRWVARLLSHYGASVSVGVRDEDLAEKVLERYRIDADICVIDIERQPDVLGGWINRLQPAVVFNLMGYGVDRMERSEGPAYAVNAELPLKLCEWLAGYESQWSGSRLIHVGSALEYGELTNDLNEESVPRPTTLYGRSKLAGTENVTRFSRSDGLSALTARLFTVFGCGEHKGRLLPSLIDAAGTGSVLSLTEGLQQRDFCFVEDVAEGLLRLAAAPHRGETVVNLATGQLNPVRRFVELAAAELGIDSAKLKFGALPGRAEEMSHQPVNVNRLKQITDWLPPADLQQGIRRSLAFERSADGSTFGAESL